MKLLLGLYIMELNYQRLFGVIGYEIADERGFFARMGKGGEVYHSVSIDLFGEVIIHSEDAYPVTFG